MKKISLKKSIGAIALVVVSLLCFAFGGIIALLFFLTLFFLSARVQRLFGFRDKHMNMVD